VSGAFAAAIAIGTLGLAETQTVAVAADAETQNGKSTNSTSEQNSSVVQEHAIPTVQAPAAEYVRNDDLASKAVGMRASVLDAFVTTPETVATEEAPFYDISASGVVYDALGRVQPGVHVSLIAAHNRVSFKLEKLQPIVAHTTTNAKGEFSFVNVASVQEEVVLESRRIWRLVAMSEDGKVGWANVESSAQPATITHDIVLSESSSVEGKVIDENRRPLVGATIQANYWTSAAEFEANDGAVPSELDGVFLHEVNLGDTTDTSGHFAIEGLPASSLVEFMIRHPSIADKRIFFTTTNDPSELELLQGVANEVGPMSKSGNEIVCKAGILVNGHVVDESGQPVASTISVRVGGRSVATKTVGGRFSLRVPSRDEYQQSNLQSRGRQLVNTMYVFPDDRNGYMVAIAELAPEVLAAKSLDFVLRKRSEYSGRIVNFEGEGVSGVGVLVRTTPNPVADNQQHVQTEPVEAFARATSDAQGNFNVLLPEGGVDFLLNGRVPGFDLVQNSRFEDINGQLYHWPNDLKATYTVVIQETERQLDNMAVREISRD
jgi:hypothetical protein